jgi:iron(III) transport system permease protein
MSVVTAGGESVELRLPRVRASAVWPVVMLVVVMLLVLTPLMFLVLGSFSQARLPSEFTWSGLSFANYAKVWSDPATYAVVSNTLWFAGGSTLVGLTLAASLAWLVERTDMPCKLLIYAGVPMTLAMPGMLQSMAWVLLASPRSGFLNKGAIELLGLTAPPFNIYGLGGMVFIEGMRMVPTAFLMLVPLLRSMDPSLEDAARMSGAAPVDCLRRVTLGLMLPGLLAVGIYQFTSALEAFEVPGILGMPSGTFVFATRIYSVLHSASALPAYGEANALAIVYLLVAVVATWLYGRVITRSERYAIITGKGYRPRVLALGPWRWGFLALALLYLALSTLIPFLVLVYISFLPFLQPPSPAAFARMSFANYHTIFATEQLGRTLWNTLVMTFATATVTAIFSFLVSLVIVRSKFWGRRLLDQLAFMPHAIPGMAMGLALLWVFLQVDKTGVSMFGSITSIVIAFVISYMAYGTRAMNAAVVQVHADLEDAAKVSGAPQWQVLIRIFCPLLLPALGGVWIWTVLHVVRAASLPLMLADGPSNEVLAVVIWQMWDQGYVEAVGAIGTLLMLFLLAITLALRLFGFGRGIRS